MMLYASYPSDNSPGTYPHTSILMVTTCFLYFSNILLVRFTQGMGMGMGVAGMIVNLVGGLVAMFCFPMNIGNVIIPIDELIFFRGVAQPPTSDECGQIPVDCNR